MVTYRQFSPDFAPCVEPVFQQPALDEAIETGNAARNAHTGVSTVEV